MSGHSVESDATPCGGERRSRADWMGEFQSESCPCVRPKGHAGPHACDHDKPADACVLPPTDGHTPGGAA